MSFMQSLKTWYLVYINTVKVWNVLGNNKHKTLENSYLWGERRKKLENGICAGGF